MTTIELMIPLHVLERKKQTSRVQQEIRILATQPKKNSSINYNEQFVLVK